MSEIDRVSITGTYQTLPVAAKRRTKEDARTPFGEHPPDGGEPPQHSEQQSKNSQPTAAVPRLPRSIIDEFA